MSIDQLNIKDREFQKYVESPTRPGKTAVEVFGSISTGSGSFDPPVGTDYIGRSVASNVETYLYKSGGEFGTLLKTITVTYVAADLEELLKVEVS